MNWADIKYVFNQLRNGKEIPKKSEKSNMLESDWIDLQKLGNVTKYSFDHQGISPGIYIVRAKIRFEDDNFDRSVSNFADASDDGYGLPAYTDATYKVFFNLSTRSFSASANFVSSSYSARIEVKSVRVKRIM